MPLPNFIRFNDPKGVRHRQEPPQLENLKRNEGFPPGRLLSPNVRAWTEEEIHRVARIRARRPKQTRIDSAL